MTGGIYSLGATYYTLLTGKTPYHERESICMLCLLTAMTTDLNRRSTATIYLKPADKSSQRQWAKPPRTATRA